MFLVRKVDRAIAKKAKYLRLIASPIQYAGAVHLARYV
jgi:hypothetical protein